MPVPRNAAGRNTASAEQPVRQNMQKQRHRSAVDALLGPAEWPKAEAREAKGNTTVAATAAAAAAAATAGAGRTPEVECGKNMAFRPSELASGSCVVSKSSSLFHEADAAATHGRAAAAVAAVATVAAVAAAAAAAKTIAGKTVDMSLDVSTCFSPPSSAAAEAVAGRLQAVVTGSQSATAEAAATPGAASASSASEADANEAKPRAVNLSADAAGGSEAGLSPEAAGGEVAHWGSSVPRMPAALRDGFLAEVKLLQKKPIMKITTSVEGAYGESSVSSLFKLFSLLNERFGLNEHSTFLDIGSGSGVPSLAAAAFGCTYTLGLELDSNVYSISVINHLSLVDLLLLQQLYLGVQLSGQHTENYISGALQAALSLSRISATATATEEKISTKGAAVEWNPQKNWAATIQVAASLFRDTASAEAAHSSSSRATSSLESTGDATAGVGQAERRLLETTLGFNGTFCVFDCCRLSSLEGISHVFSFDLAMPPWVMAHTVKLFNQSKTTFVFVSFHGDLVSNFGLHAVLADRLCMRMNTSAESHVGFIYQKIPQKEGLERQEEQINLQCSRQHPLAANSRPYSASPACDSAVVEAEDSEKQSRRLEQQRKHLGHQLICLRKHLRSLHMKHKQLARQPNDMQHRRKEVLRALEALKQKTLQTIQQMLQKKQQALLLQQKLQLVALLEQQQKEEPMASHSKLVEEAARLVEQQHFWQQQELVQRLSLQYWAEEQRQKDLLETAAVTVATKQYSRAKKCSAEFDKEVQQIKQRLQEKQEQLHKVECMIRRNEQEQKRRGLEQKGTGIQLQQQSQLEGRCFESSSLLLDAAQKHARDVQERQQQQLLLLKGIASSRTDRILHSVAAAGRLQQVTQIFVAAVCMLPNPVPPQDGAAVAAAAAKQKEKFPCCCTTCCSPQEDSGMEQTTAFTARVELVSAAHPQQQLLLLRRVLSAFQIDQLLERGSLMEQQQEAAAAARVESLLTHIRDIRVEVPKMQIHPAAQRMHATNAHGSLQYQCPCSRKSSCFRQKSGNNSSNCSVCIVGAAAALADLLLSTSRSCTVEVRFCSQWQKQLQRKRHSRLIRRHAATPVNVAANSTSSETTEAPVAASALKPNDNAKRGEQELCNDSGSVQVILPCLSPMCATCCYSDSLLLQLLRCSFPLAVQQQLLQQEVFMQQRMPLITVIDKQEQQQLEQQRIQDWKMGEADVAKPAATTAGFQTAFKRGTVECPLADALYSLQLLQHQLSQMQQSHEEPINLHEEPDAQSTYFVAAFNREFKELLKAQQRKQQRWRRSLRQTEPAAIAGVECRGEDGIQARCNSDAVPPTSCGSAVAKRPRSSGQQDDLRLLAANSVSGRNINATAKATVHTVVEYPRTIDTDLKSAAGAVESRSPEWAAETPNAGEDAALAAGAIELRLQPHEKQLLLACAVAAAHPTPGACRGVLELLQQHHKLLLGQPSHGYSKDILPSNPLAIVDHRTGFKRRVTSSHAGRSLTGDSANCSTSSSDSTCSSSRVSGIGWKTRRHAALVRTALQQLELVKNHLTDMHAAQRRHLLQKLLQRDFPGHRAFAAGVLPANRAAETVQQRGRPVHFRSCNCAPLLQLEQQEVLLREDRGSCIWWREYYILLGELAVIKEKALYEAVDTCLQQQQRPVPQQPMELPVQAKQQALLEGHIKESVASSDRTTLPEEQEPRNLKACNIGCRLHDSLLQSPLAPRKRRSEVWY